MSLYKKLIVEPHKRVRLEKIDPDWTGKHKNDGMTQAKLETNLRKITKGQYELYAENKQSLLIVLQGLDGAGKDGTVNHVLGAMNPQGVHVHGFKVPSKEEAAHDFLWRCHQHTPGKGEVAIFNRSHYEDVLVVRVHKLVEKSVWSGRYELINDFEKMLEASGTRVIKFFLHISEEEQLKRFYQRLEDPARNWKISEADYTEREFWPEYTEAYEECLSKTSTKHAPWFVIPSNNKWFRNYAISTIVRETLEDMKIQMPEPTVDIAAIRRKYHSAKRGERKLRSETRQLV